jgi:hypothetical protein
VSFQNETEIQSSKNILPWFKSITKTKRPLPIDICGKFGPDMNMRSLAVRARVTLLHWSTRPALCLQFRHISLETKILYSRETIKRFSLTLLG